MDLAAPGHDIDDLERVQVRVELHPWRDQASLVLDEVERVNHVVRCDLTMNANAEEADDCALQ